MRGRDMRCAALLLMWAVMAAGCGRPEMETRTFRLQKLEAGRAGELLQPYVSAVEGGSMSIVNGETPALTIRQTRAALDRIAEVLAEYDRPDPILTLRFRVIEADGFETDEQALGDVLPVLRDVLGFDGYRLLGETQAIAGAWGETRQTIYTGDQDQFKVYCSVGEIRTTENAGSVRLRVSLDNLNGEVLSTEVTVPIGRSVVLGTSKPLRQRGAFILTVEPTYTAGG